MHCAHDQFSSTLPLSHWHPRNQIDLGWQFQALLRKRLELNPQQALFVFVDNVLPNAAGSMALLYAQSPKDADGVLHLQYGGENTFG